MNRKLGIKLGPHENVITKRYKEIIAKKAAKYNLSKRAKQKVRKVKEQNIPNNPINRRVLRPNLSTNKTEMRVVKELVTVNAI